MPILTPTPTPTPTPRVPVSLDPTPTYIVIDSDPSWADIAGVVVSALAAVGSLAVAVIAVVLTVRLAKEESRRADRAARAEWARAYTKWMQAGKVYMAAGIDAAILTDPAWVYEGDDIHARARLLSSPGATEFMLEARKAWTHMEGMPPDKGIPAALTAVRMLVFWVEGWVDDPKKRPGDIVPWLDLAGASAAR